jgi:hypothetical protein
MDTSSKFWHTLALYGLYQDHTLTGGIMRDIMTPAVRRNRVAQATRLFLRERIGADFLNVMLCVTVSPTK